MSLKSLLGNALLAATVYEAATTSREDMERAAYRHKKFLDKQDGIEEGDYVNEDNYHVHVHYHRYD